MAWSTREIAEIAGTTLRTVRHYHDLGLLDVPDRGVNGYKRYGVEHLRQLLRIRRLVHLGLTLPQVHQALRGGGLAADSLRDLDSQVAATMQQLQAVRDELAVLVRRTTPEERYRGEDLGELTDVDLPPADDAFLAVLTGVVVPQVRESYRAVVKAGADEPVLVELDRLEAGADEGTRADLAERLAAHVSRLHGDHPLLHDVFADSGLSPTTARRTLTHIVSELYNPAQVDVVRRVGALLASR